MTRDQAAKQREAEPGRREREEVIKAMPHEHLANHLAIQGWVPVQAGTAAVARGPERVFLVGHANGLSVAYSEHPGTPKRTEVPWSTIKPAHLRMLAVRIAGDEL